MKRWKDHMKNKNRKGMWKRTFFLFRHIRIPWHLYLLQVVLGIISTKVALLYIPYETDLKLGRMDKPGVLMGYLGLMLLSLAAMTAEKVPTFYSAGQVTMRLQNRLIFHSLRLPMAAFEKNASKIVSWITQDCSFADGLITSIVGFITGLVTVYMTVSEMSAIDMSLISIVPAICIYILFSTWLEGKLMFLRERRGRGARADMMAYLSEHLGYFTEIRKLHSGTDELVLGKIAFENFYLAEIYQAVLTLIDGIVAGSVSDIINIFVFVLGVPLVRKGSISMPDLVAFQNYILIAYNAIKSIPDLYISLKTYQGQLFYIAELEAEEEEVYERSLAMGMPEQDIVFENVSFAYGEKSVFQNVSFTIPKGKKTVIVGRNGSGKTTIFKLLERFYQPQDGHILYGKYPAEEIHLSDWRKKFVYVLQEAKLFDGSIRENIAYGLSEKVTEEEIRQAAEIAGVDTFADKLPDGYDFVVGDDGIRLSVGQRQRIAIARAVLLNPSYLLLDEAMCNMDVSCERKVSEALSRLMENRTTIMISHDMDTVTKADHVIVVGDGTIEAEGEAAELTEKSQTLRELLGAEG